MANIDKHPAGSFCWIELHTSDQPAAKSFYSSLFGWEAHDNPMGIPNDFYTMFKLQGRHPAAGCTLRPEERSHGVPPHWMIYIAKLRTPTQPPPRRSNWAAKFLPRHST